MASRGINKVILVGHLGQDPEVKFTASQQAVCNISIATSTSWTDKTSGDKQERTEWHRVVLYQRLAEIAGEYLRKGSQIYIEGRLQTRKWQDQNGTDRYTTEIVANDMQMLGGRGGSAGMDAPGMDDQGFGAAQPAANPKPAPAMSDDLDDDIPF